MSIGGRVVSPTLCIDICDVDEKSGFNLASVRIKIERKKNLHIERDFTTRERGVLSIVLEIRL